MVKQKETLLCTIITIPFILCMLAALCYGTYELYIWMFPFLTEKSDPNANEHLTGKELMISIMVGFPTVIWTTCIIFSIIYGVGTLLEEIINKIGCLKKHLFIDIPDDNNTDFIANEHV